VSFGDLTAGTINTRPASARWDRLGDLGELEQVGELVEVGGKQIGQRLDTATAQFGAADFGFNTGNPLFRR